jgi:hypothetical protein
MAVLDATPAANSSATEASSVGNEEHDGGRRAYAFRSGLWRAVTLDPSESNLPALTDGVAWVLEHRSILGVRNIRPDGINPEPIIRGILSAGYYLWRPSDPSCMAGTSQ